MSERTKGRHTNRAQFIEIVVGIPGKEELIYQIPNTADAKSKLKKFFQNFIPQEDSQEESTPWRKLAKSEIEKYTEVGMALRGARYREGLSQKALAKLCDISQDNLSRMEHGKRTIGEKLAKKLGKVLGVDYRLFIREKR
jgi:ribosome-binding protein aMBF1 (putative translation factor)